MKHLNIILTLFTILQGFNAIAGNKYQIATWYNFTSAAISYTYDDNCSNQTKVVIPMMNEFDFKGTFYPVVNWGPDWSKFSAAAENGHEIGCHTMNHPSLGNISVDSQRYEISKSVEEINKRILSQKVTTIAYPNCVPSDAGLNSEYFIAGRNCQGTVENPTPTNFFNISSIICGANGSVKTSADFIDRAERAKVKEGWAVYLIHGIDGDGGYSNISSKTLRKSFEYFDTLRTDYWVSTFSNVARYIYERNAATVTEVSATSNAIELNITDTLNNAIFTIPLTLRTELPTGWDWAEAKQVSGTVNVMNCTVVTVDTKKYIQFDAVPDGGLVILTKAVQPVSVNPSQQLNVKVYPNPFTNTLTVNASGNFSYAVYSLQGQLIEKGNGNQQLQIGERLEQGIYLLNIVSDKGQRTVKISKY
jgi:peptidoglycan/xylan/chitin deacetylase (PgdA/CDA1 family)